MSERGNASIAAMAAAVLVMVLIAGLGDMAIFLFARSKAQTAADAAALAAAAEQIPGMGTDPAAQAARFAGENGAGLVSCDCPVGGEESVVRVEVPVRFVLIGTFGKDSVSARAKAQFDTRKLLHE